MITPLKEITDVKWLREACEYLWSIVDDIDTADDMCKEDNISFREYVMLKQRDRFCILVSDGYTLFKSDTNR